MATRLTHAAAQASRRRVLLAMSWGEHDQTEGIFRYAAEAGWIFRHLNAPQPKQVRQFKLQGTLFQLHGAADPKLIASISSMRLPKVDMYHFHWPPKLPRKYDFRTPRTVPCVYTDSRAEGSLAAGHLADHGFSRLVYIGEGPDTEYYWGFKEVADQRKCSLTSIFNSEPDIKRQIGFDTLQSPSFHDEWSPKRQKWARRIIAKLATPVGIFADNHIWASDIIDGCLAAGILIPEQVGLVTAVDIEHQGSCFTVPTTVVVPDYEQQGYQAAALLDRMMHGERVSATTCILVPPKAIVQRDSTRVHASDDINVTRATRYIMQHVHDPSLSSKVVCHASNVSTSTLYRAFARHIGMSVADYIEKVRINEATSLLATTDLTASTIAEQCGFTELRHLRNALDRVTGLTPSAYREMHGRR